MGTPLYNRCQDENCYPCTAEASGCPCDGSFDDGCWQCNPERYARPPCGPWTEETASGVPREATP